MEQKNVLYIAHSGIKGQKWGRRRYQNPDGTLTEEGKRRYGYGEGSKPVGKTIGLGLGGAAAVVGGTYGANIAKAAKLRKTLGLISSRSGSPYPSADYGVTQSLLGGMIDSTWYRGDASQRAAGHVLSKAAMNSSTITAIAGAVGATALVAGTAAIVGKKLYDRHKINQHVKAEAMNKKVSETKT